MENKITTEEIDGRINALVAQRNSAMDGLAVATGRIAYLEKRLEEMQKQIDETNSETQ